MVSSIVGRCPYPTPCGKYRRCAERWRRGIWLRELAPPCLPRCDQANWQPRGWRERSAGRGQARSEEHTSELQSLIRISYAFFFLLYTFFSLFFFFFFFFFFF